MIVSFSSLIIVSSKKGMTIAVLKICPERSDGDHCCGEAAAFLCSRPSERNPFGMALL